MKIQWKFLVITLVIGWFLGAASGFVILRYCHTGSFTGRHGRHRERFYKELKLTPEQRTRVDSILNANRQKMNEIFAQTRTQIDEVRNSTRDQIRQLLTPDQQIAYDEWHAKMEERFHRRFAPLYDRPRQPK